MATWLAVFTHAATAANGEWNFTVLLEEAAIGEHRFSVGETADGRRLVSEADFAVKFVGITAYRYRHKATEQWRGECLTSLTSSTNDDGTSHQVRTDTDGSGLTVFAGTAAPRKLPGCTMSFAYWNPRIRTQTQLLNAQTGELETVRIVALGAGTIEVRGKPTTAMRWRINGPARSIDVWYSAQGDWLGLDSFVAGNRKLTYRLK